MDVERVRRRALELANEGFDERVRSLLAAAEAKPELLAEAAAEITTPQGTAGNPEHVAFTYLTAAFKLATGKDAEPGEDSPIGDRS